MRCFSICFGWENIAGIRVHLVGNNVYMDLDMMCRKIQFKRTRTGVERSEIYRKIQRYKNKLKPDYAGRVCMETVQCVFRLPEEEAEKWKIQYEGQETYAFPMSNKYILGLFTHCEAARKSVVESGVEYEYLAEEEQKILRLENVRDVLFQALLLVMYQWKTVCFVQICVRSCCGVENRHK